MGDAPESTFINTDEFWACSWIDLPGMRGWRERYTVNPWSCFCLTEKGRNLIIRYFGLEGIADQLPCNVIENLTPAELAAMKPAELRKAA